MLLLVVNKVESLKKKSDFENLSTKGKKARIGPWLRVIYLVNQEQNSRFAWSISTKVGKANLRNKLKRWLRNYFRERTLQKNYDVNVIVLPQAKDYFKDMSFQEFKSFLDRLIL